MIDSTICFRWWVFMRYKKEHRLIILQEEGTHFGIWTMLSFTYGLRISKKKWLMEGLKFIFDRWNRGNLSYIFI